MSPIKTSFLPILIFNIVQPCRQKTVLVTTKAKAFGIFIVHLAEQVETAMEYTEALKNYDIF